MSKKKKTGEEVVEGKGWVRMALEPTIADLNELVDKLNNRVYELEAEVYRLEGENYDGKQLLNLYRPLHATSVPEPVGPLRGIRVASANFFNSVKN